MFADFFVCKKIILKRKYLIIKCCRMLKIIRKGLKIALGCGYIRAPELYPRLEKLQLKVPAAAAIRQPAGIATRSIWKRTKFKKKMKIIAN